MAKYNEDDKFNWNEPLEQFTSQCDTCLFFKRGKCMVYEDEPPREFETDKEVCEAREPYEE